MKIGDLVPPQRKKYEQPMIYQGQPNEKIKDYAQPHFTRTAQIGKHLYHGTISAWLPLILHQNQLKEGAYWGKQNEPHGVRFSRDIGPAKNYAFEQECPGGAILTLDWAKLNKRFGTTSYHDTRYEGISMGDDQEEVVLTPMIKPLRNYIVAIHVDPAFFSKTTIKGTWEYIVDYTGGEPYNDQKTFLQLYNNIRNYRPQFMAKT